MVVPDVLITGTLGRWDIDTDILRLQNSELAIAACYRDKDQRRTLLANQTFWGH